MIIKNLSDVNIGIWEWTVTLGTVIISEVHTRMCYDKMVLGICVPVEGPLSDHFTCGGASAITVICNHNDRVICFSVIEQR